MRFDESGQLESDNVSAVFKSQKTCYFLFFYFKNRLFLHTTMSMQKVSKQMIWKDNFKACFNPIRTILKPSYTNSHK